MTKAGDLAHWASELDYADIPPHVIAAVEERLLDTIGVMIAGAESDAGRIVRKVALSWDGPQEASILGETTKVRGATAALVNGTYAHALDFDDTHLPSILHPSAPIVPAAIAQGQRLGASGRDLIVALTAAYETACRLGLAQYDPIRRESLFIVRGLHVSSYVGAIGSAIACGKLDGRDAEGLTHAITVAASMGAGLIESSRSGGSIKKFQGGWAAQCGYVAAELAAAGLTGAPTALEGKFGFFEALAGPGWREGELLRGLGTEWLTPTIMVKPYPCTHFTHALVDAALALRRRGVEPGRVAATTLRVASSSVAAIGEPIDLKRRPISPYHAQFSGPFVFARALIGGGGLGIALADFSDDALNDPLVRRLCDATTVVGDPECDAVFPEQFPAIVDVTLEDGRVIEERIMTNRGSAGRPLTGPELETKLAQTAGDRAEGIAASVGALDGSRSLSRLIDSTVRLQ